MPIKWPALGLLIFVASAGMPIVIAQEATTPAPRVIEMTAKNYDFAPSSVHVKVGERVQLKVTATDREHGVKIVTTPVGSPKDAAAGIEVTSTPDCIKFKKDETGTVEFIARSPGTYEFECCKLCGMGHGKMKGQIIVDPS